MKSLKLVILLAALIHISPSAFAERTVGNGGGLAEMRAIYLHQRLSSYLIPCVVQPASCGISNEEAASFSQAVKAAAMAVPSSLVIDTSVSEAEIFVTPVSKGATIRLSPKALYAQVGSVLVPKSTSEIAGVLLAAYWTQSGAESKANAVSLAARITSRFEESSSQLPVRISSKTSILIHQQMLRLSDVEELVILVEDQAKTINATPESLDQIVCESGDKPTRSDLQALRLVNASATSVTVALEMASECATSMTYKTVVLSFNLNSKG
ncbi:MAG: hypothetical protein EOP05_12355, partial [Proteobacteria bacterium]